jgi:hypothetical protein
MTFKELQRRSRCQRCGKTSRAAVIPDDTEWLGRD